MSAAAGARVFDEAGIKN